MRTATQAARRAQLLDVARPLRFVDRSSTVQRAAPTKLHRRCAGLVAVVLTVENTSWLTLENLGQRGTFRSSASWPDTKILSLVIAAIALAAGAAAALRAWRAAQPRTVLPKATLRP